MRQECIDTIETTTAPQLSWGQWAKAGVRMVRDDTVQIINLLWIWHERSQERFRLQQLSDETLKDVALSRADIEGECSKPFWMR